MITKTRQLIAVSLLPVVTLIYLAIGAGCSPSADEDQSGESDMRPAQELLARADSVFGNREYVAAREIYLQAKSEAEQAGHNSDLTEALAMIARTYLITGETEIGRNWIDRTEQVADSTQPRGWSRYLGVRGRFLWQDDRLDSATAMFENMYDYCSAHKLHERAIDAAHMVAITGSLEEQVEWGRKGIAEAEAGDVTGWLGPLWNNLGATYEHMEKYDSSLAAYLKAREYHHQYGTEIGKVIADWAVGHAYVNLEQYDEAEKWLEPALARFEALEDNEFIGLTCMELGEVAYARSHFEEALAYFERAEKLLSEAGMADWDEAGYNRLVERIDQCRDKI